MKQRKGEGTIKLEARYLGGSFEPGCFLWIRLKAVKSNHSFFLMSNISFKVMCLLKTNNDCRVENNKIETIILIKCSLNI